MAWGFLAALTGCISAPAIGRGGQVYDVVVRTLDGRPTALRGPPAHACTIQVGDTVNQVWLARDGRLPTESPVVLRADAAALRAGIALEIGGWPNVAFHRVTPSELQAEAILMHVPGPFRAHEVEIWFRPHRQMAAFDAPVQRGTAAEPAAPPAASD